VPVSKQTLATIRVAAFSVGRHAVTYTAGAATGVAGVLAIYGGTLQLSPDDVSKIVSSFNGIAFATKSIVDGVGTLVGSVSTLAAIGMAWWARHSISPKQAATVAADCLPNTTIITDPNVANSTPKQPNIVSNAETHVVQGLS